MLKDLLPKSHRRYTSLPLLGKLAVDFAAWLVDEGYPRRTCRWFLFRFVRIDKFLRRRGRQQVSDITSDDLTACFKRYRLRKKETATTASALRRYMTNRGLLAYASGDLGEVDALISVYANYLRDVRGFTDATVRAHVSTAGRFLRFVQHEEKSPTLAALTSSDIENFLCRLGKNLSRGTLQHVVAQLRGFLRFLSTRGEVQPSIGEKIDAPLLYRREKPPRALPWRSVRAFLESIDRSIPMGLRDYTMFFLMATYGLRSCEIVRLMLDDIDWRDRSVRVSRRKNGDPLILPLTDDAGTVLLHYLQRARPPCRYRHLFLRSRAPNGPLNPSALSVNFRVWLKRSKLDLSCQGSHCFRHSYAVHLLRLGTSLKTIGDLLGHRLVESTCCYLGLATEDLREVALSLPQDRESGTKS